MADPPNIAVFGAGAVGCFIGGAWLAAGCKVSFIGRPAIRDELKQHGLSLSDYEGWKVHLAADRIDFSSDAKAVRRADLIALTVKSTNTVEAAREIARHARGGTTLVSFQNGVSNVAALKSKLPKLEVLQGMVPYNVVRLGPGRFHRATWGDLAAAPAPSTRALATQVSKQPGRIILSEDMVGIAWGKLLINLNNAINALSGMTILEQLKQRDFRRVLAAAIVEAVELLEVAGIEPAKIGQIPPRLLPHAIGAPDWVFNNLFLRVQKIDPRGKGSMAVDLEAGRLTEIDYLNGEVVKLARSLGRKAPVNERIVQLVKAAEQGIETVWTPEQLRRHVLEEHKQVPGFGY